MGGESQISDADASVGLCATCRYGSTQESAKGSVFWRCLAADADERLRRYPPLPVLRCPAFEGTG